MVLVLDPFSGQQVMLSLQTLEDKAPVLNPHTKQNLTEGPGLIQSTK